MNYLRLSSLTIGFLLLSTLRKRRKLAIPKLIVSSTLIYQGLKGSELKAFSTVIDKKYIEVRNVNIKVSISVNKPRHEVIYMGAMQEVMPNTSEFLSPITDAL